jgi:hypothetical protein
MIDVNKGENIVLLLQLIKSDGISIEDEATVSYSIYDSSATVEVVSEQSTSYNSITQSYTDTLVPSASWTNQEVGHYLVVWSVSNTDDDFNSVYTEQLNINIDKNLIDRILGLVHQNIEIDETRFDQFGNMKSARLRIFREASKTNVIATYRITAKPNGPGRFTTWEQVEE